MADITVETATRTDWYGRHKRSLVWTTKDIGYAIYITGSLDLEYRKTINGGATWSGSSILISNSNTIIAMDIWFDKWTPGNNGTLIRIWWMESTGDDVHYVSLDISDDSIGTDRIIFLGTTFSTTTPRDEKQISGAVAGNGDLYVQFWGDDDGERGFYRSQDDGATWFGRTDGADGDTPDEVVLMASDGVSGDMVMIYWDRSADELDLKRYIASSNTWSTTLISASMVDPPPNPNEIQLGAMIRHSDNHIIVVAWSELDTVTADLRVWDIETSTPTITPKTNIITNKANVIGAALCIDQNNNDLYVGYLGNESGSEDYLVTVTAFFKKSTDGGATWSAQQAYQQGAAVNSRVVDGGTSTPGVLEGRFAPTFVDDDSNDMFINKVNSVELLEIAGTPGGKSSVGRGVGRGVLEGAI